MGTLTIHRYPTGMAARLADHTYVTCCEAKGWGCWGGKIGGSALRSGAGSTARADAIAGPDERAGVTCYLVNGVCHQAANRIGLAAGLTVRGARGYGVSEALFGVYGRPRGYFGTCRAPFARHVGMTGEIPECMSADSSKLADAAPPDPYLRAVLTLWEIGPGMRDEDEATFQFALAQFSLMARDRLGDDWFESGPIRGLMEIRAEFEHERRNIDEALHADARGVAAIADAFDQLTIRFQKQVLEHLGPERFRRLFEQDPDDVVTLSDPLVIEALDAEEGDARY